MKNVFLIPDNYIGYVCGYIAWMKSKGNKDDNIFVLMEDLKLANIDIDKKTTVYLLGHVMSNNDMLYISNKANVISVIDKFNNIRESDLDGIYNINLIHAYKSTIGACWNEFITDGKEMPKALQLLENLTDNKSINFEKGIRKLGVRTNYEYWDIMSNNDIMIDRVVELGSKE